MVRAGLRVWNRAISEYSNYPSQTDVVRFSDLNGELRFLQRGTFFSVYENCINGAHRRCQFTRSKEIKTMGLHTANVNCVYANCELQKTLYIAPAVNLLR